jgi:hypothetical protein
MAHFIIYPSANQKVIRPTKITKDRDGLGASIINRNFGMYGVGEQPPVVLFLGTTSKSTAAALFI